MSVDHEITALQNMLPWIGRGVGGAEVNAEVNGYQWLPKRKHSLCPCPLPSLRRPFTTAFNQDTFLLQ